jgi:acyl carrier protein
MDTHAIASELRSFIREHFKVPEDDPDFNDKIDLFNYGYIDSFGAVDLTTFVEERFSITYTASDWTRFPLNTIENLAAFVSMRQKGDA